MSAPTTKRSVVLFGLLLLALPLAACRKSGTCAGKDLLVEVSGNHGHAERIPAAELERGAHSYRLEGGSHEHGVRLSDADLAALTAGKSVERRTSSMNGHVHEVRLSCER